DVQPAPRGHRARTGVDDARTGRPRGAPRTARVTATTCRSEPAMADDDLHDFEHASFTHDGKTRTVYRLGTGPAVIVIAEMPGISPKVAGFARKVAAAGCTAVMPHLFGVPGRDIDPRANGRMRTMAA